MTKVAVSLSAMNVAADQMAASVKAGTQRSVTAEIARYASNLEAWSHIEAGLRHKDGSVRYLESSAVPVLKDGVFAGFRGAARDVTERKRAEDRLRALLAVMSSFVFEFLVRTRLTTGHMSLGAVRRAQLPPLTSGVVASLSAATHCLDSGSRDQVALEVLVAKAYGLGRDTFEAILKQFPKVLPQEREILLNADHWAS